MKRSKAEIQAYIDQAKDILGLGNWEIEVLDDQVDDPTNDYAHINPEDCADIATVRFGPKFHESNEAKQIRIVAHELVHLHAYRTTHFVESLKKRVHPDSWDLFFEEYERKEDEMVENLTKLVATMLPRWRTKS